VHGTCITHEVESRPRKARKKLHWQEVAFEAVAARTGGNQVAGCMRAAVTDRLHMIECGSVQGEWPSAVDATSTAVAHRGLLYGALGFGVAMWGEKPGLALRARTACETARRAWGVVL